MNIKTIARLYVNAMKSWGWAVVVLSLVLSVLSLYRFYGSGGMEERGPRFQATVYINMKFMGLNSPGISRFLARYVNDETGARFPSVKVEDISSIPNKDNRVVLFSENKKQVEDYTGFIVESYKKEMLAAIDTELGRLEKLIGKAERKYEESDLSEDMRDWLTTARRIVRENVEENIDVKINPNPVYSQLIYLEQLLERRDFLVELAKDPGLAIRVINKMKKTRGGAPNPDTLIPSALAFALFAGALIVFIVEVGLVRIRELASDE